VDPAAAACDDALPECARWSAESSRSYVWSEASALPGEGPRRVGARSRAALHRPGTRCRCSGGSSRKSRMRCTTRGSVEGGGVWRARDCPKTTWRSSGSASRKRRRHFFTQLPERPRELSLHYLSWRYSETYLERRTSRTVTLARCGSGVRSTSMLNTSSCIHQCSS
jgi:hypothetical protein